MLERLLHGYIKPKHRQVITLSPPQQWELLITAVRVIQGPLQCERSIGLTDDITKSSVTLSLQLLYWSHLSQLQTLFWG